MLHEEYALRPSDLLSADRQWHRESGELCSPLIFELDLE